MAHITYTDEYLDLVDDQDVVIGKKLRSEIYSAKLLNFRVVNAFLKNSKGELWIPRRTAHKRLFPLCLDVSVGGHVGTGESYDEALKREALEEIRCNVEQLSVKLLAHLSPYVDGVHGFMNVYEIHMDETPKYNKHDFIEYFWLSPKAALEKIRADKAKEDLPKLINILYVS